MDMDVVGNKERLLKGILDGETTTDIEPASREERLLKAILENGGGGGGGGATSVTLAASGDNLSGDISLADLKTALSNGVVLLSFPTDGNADERVVAEYTDDSTNGLRIGVFSEDEYIVYSVVDDGSDGITLTVVSEKGLSEKEIEFVTLSATTQQTLGTAFQTFIAAAAAAPNTYVHTSTSAAGISEMDTIVDYIRAGKIVQTEFNGYYYTIGSATIASSQVGKQFRIDIPINGLTIQPNVSAYGTVSVLVDSNGAGLTGILNITT